MKYAEVAENVKKLVENPPPNDEFIYEILLAYGTPKATIARLKSGSINLSKEPGEVLLKKKVWFKSVETNVAQASRLPDAVEPKVGQASSLSSPGEPSDGGQAGSMSYIPSDSKQAGRLLYVKIEELKAEKKTKTNNPRFLKQTITMHVGNVLQERENHSGKTMAQLYDPDKMPAGLREAHHQLDLAVDRLYRSKPFTSDEERLEHLFKLYEEMTAKEKLI